MENTVGMEDKVIKEYDVMQILLGMDVPGLPEKEVRLKRLSEAAGKPIVFRLRGLSYGKCAELGKLDESNVHIVLAGVTEPNLRDETLRAHIGGPTPAEMLKKLLLPGEIEDLSREIEKLSGYRENTLETVEEIKKK